MFATGSPVLIDDTVQTIAPTTGQTAVVQAGRRVWLVINPAGTIAALTITFPASGVDGDTIFLTSTQIVTALTMNGGTTLGALSALAVASFGRWRWHAAIAKWLRVA